MNCDELQQLSALGAVGLLEEADLARWRERLDRDPEARLEFARFCDAATALVAGGVVRRRPRRDVRERVLEQVRRTPQQRVGSGTGAPTVTPPVSSSREVSGIGFVGRDAPWLPAPLPGARYKVLSSSEHQAHVLLLIELGPGTVYPEHDHLGTEDMYVLTGDLQTEGRSLGPGDSLHAEPGSHHGELRTIEGCTALMVVPREAAAELAGV